MAKNIKKDLLHHVYVKNEDIIEKWPREVIGECNYSRSTGIAIVAWEPGVLTEPVEVRHLVWN